MTQDEYNTARDLIKEGLEVIADGLVDEASGEANVQELLILTGMLNDCIKAVVSLQNDDAVGAQERLDWLNEDDEIEFGPVDCMCDECTKERAEAAN